MDANLNLRIDSKQAVTADKALKDLERSGRQAEAQFKSLERNSGQLGSAMSALGGALAGIGLASIAKDAILAADNFNMLQQRIQTATKATGDYASVSQRLYSIAQQTGTALESNVVLFQSLARVAPEIGATNKQMLTLTKTLQQLGTIGGASRGQMSNAMLQFGQAMAGGIMRAEEFNSIIENTPEVASRIAQGMDMTVGHLRMAVLEGTVLSKDVFDALISQAKEINQEASSMYVNLSRAGEMLSNSIQNAVAALDESTKVTSVLSMSLQGWSMILDSIFEKKTALQELDEEIVELQNEINEGQSIFGNSYIQILAKQRELNDLLEKKNQLLNAPLERGNVGLDLESEHNDLVDKELDALLDKAEKEQEYLDARYKATKAYRDRQLREEQAHQRALLKEQEDAAKTAADYKKEQEKAWIEAYRQYHEEYRQELEADQKAQLEHQEKTNKALDEANSLLADYGDTWTRTGDQALDAMGSMISSLVQAGKAEKKNAEMRATLEKAGLKGSKEYIALEKQKVQISVKGSADIMSAASAMFKEGSEEQQAAHNAALAMHAVTLAMQIQEAIGAATLAVANQGKGDPYTAFARIGAMSVMMAGLLSQIGATFGGVGGGVSDVALRSSSGSGVLGGGTTDSLNKSFEMMQDLEADQYTELKGIYAEMKQLNANITGIVSASYASGDFTKLANVASYKQSGIEDFVGSIKGIAESVPVLGALASFAGGAIDSVVTGLGGGGTKTSRSDYGYMLGGTLGDASIGGYETIKKDKDGGWFNKSSQSYSDNAVAIDALSQQAFGLVFANIADATKKMGQSLDRNVTDQVNAFAIDIGKISATGSSEDFAKRLNEAFSAQSDRLANEVFGDVINAYRKVSEAAFDTLARVVTEKVATTDILGMTGLDSVLEQTAGYVVDYQGTELERVNKTITGIFSSVFDSVFDFSYDQETLKTLTTGLVNSKEAAQELADELGGTVREVKTDAIALSQSLVELAGGLNELKSAADDYYDAFFDDAEKAARNQQLLTDELARHDLSLANSREGYRAMVEALDITTASGQAAYVALLQASDMADKYYKTLEDASDNYYKAIEDAASDALRSLEKSIQKRVTAIREEQRAISDSIRALDGLRNALNRTFAQIMPTISNPQQQFMQSQQVLFDALRNANETGVLPTQEEISNHLAVAGKNSHDYYSTFEEYAFDQAMTALTIKELEALAEGQLTVEQQSLARLEEQIEQYNQMLQMYQDQYDALMGIDNSVLSVRDAVTAVESALANLKSMASSGVSTGVASSSHPATPRDAYAAIGVSATDEMISYWENKNLPGSDLVNTMLSELSQTRNTADKASSAEIDRRISELSRLSTQGYATGGYTGNGGKYEPAGIVHKGEVVWSQDDVKRAGGVATVESMRKGYQPLMGYANGGAVGMSPTNNFGSIVVELRQLRQEVSGLRNENTQLLRGINNNTKDSAGYLEEMMIENEATV